MLIVFRICTPEILEKATDALGRHFVLIQPALATLDLDQGHHFVGDLSTLLGLQLGEPFILRMKEVSKTYRLRGVQENTYEVILRSKKNATS